MKPSFLSSPRRWGPIRRAIGVWLIVSMTAGSPWAIAADFYVNATTGSDANDGLTPATAWQTLTRALDGVSVDGVPNPELTGNGQDDTVHVAAGTYAATTSLPLPIIDGVNVEGPAADPTGGTPPTAIVQRSTGFPAVFRGTGNLSATTALRNLLIRNNDGSFTGGSLVELDVQGNSMAPQFTNNTFEGFFSGSPQGYGIHMQGGAGLPASFTANIQDNLFEDLNVGVFLEDDAAASRTMQTLSPTIAGNTFTDNSVGISLSGSELTLTAAETGTYAPVISGNTFTGGQTAIYMTLSISSIKGTSQFDVTPTISNNTVSGTSSRGIYLYITGSVSSSATIDFAPQIINNPSITGTGSHGIYVYASINANTNAHMRSAPVISGNTITNASGDGIRARTSITATFTADIDHSPTISNNTITGAGQGIYLYWWLYGSTMTGSVSINSNALIDGNQVIPPALPGPSATAAGIRIDPWIVDFPTANLNWDITNNVVDAAGYNGITFENTSIWNLQSGSLDLSISGNTLTGNGSRGIALNITQSAIGATFANTVLVDGNTLTSNVAEGIEFHFDAAGAAGPGDIQIINNVSTLNQGDGLNIATERFALGNVTLVSCNTITDNIGNGIYLQSITGPPPDFGGGNLASPGNNKIFNNGSVPGFYDFYNLDQPELLESPVLPVMARNNWWGTTTPATIESHIHDDDENAAVRMVDFSSFQLVPVTCGNTAPVGNPETYSTNEDVTLNVTAPGVLGNDTDADSDPLTAVLVTGPASGSLTLNPDGSFTYVPVANFNGTDSFTYMPNDGTDDGNVTTVTINVIAVNDAPVAGADSFAATEDTPLTVAAPGVLSNDTDVESSPLTAVLVTGPANGTLTLNPDGSFTYTPNGNFNGTDSFTYQASDGAASSAAQTVTLNVAAVNDPPVAVNDAYGTTESTTLNVAAPGVLSNDADPEASPLVAVLDTTTSSGTLTLNSNGSFTYTPNAGFIGVDSFTYRAHDGGLNSNIATVTIAVNNINDPPVAIDDSTSVQAGQSVTLNVLSNDSDPDGDPLAITLFSQGSQGSVSCTTSGNCTYTANASASGSDAFTYRVTDGNGGFDDGAVTVTILTSCPTEPILVSPAEGATNVPTSGTMIWDGSSSFFEVFFGPAGQGCSMSQAFLPGNSFRYSGLDGDTEYEWRVTASRTGCPTVSSPCVRFRTVQTCNASGPVLLTPASGDSVASPITFSWTAVPGATNYKVFASTGATDTLLGQTTATTLSASLPDTSTSWYVVAEGVPGCGALRSASTTFRVCNAPERPLASVIGESTSGQTYTVSWQPVANATRYEILEATNAAFADAVSFSTEAESITFTKDNVQQATPFFYQVRAFSDCFQGPGASSPTIRVVVVPIPPLDEPRSANAPVGSTRPISVQVFVPGEPGRTLRYTAVVDKPWMTVRPDSGDLPESGITLDVIVDPRGLPNGTFTGTVIVTLIEPASGRVSTDSNHTRSTPVSINLVTPVLPVSPGPPTSSSIIIPAVGHLDGGDAKWRSDVRIANTGLNLGRYLMTFTPGNPAQGIKQTSLEIGPGETTALDDVVRAWYGVGSLGESSNGVLEVRPVNTGSNFTFKGEPPNVSLATVVTSRTFAQTQGGTLGEFIPGLLFSNFVGLVEPGQVQPVLNLQQIAQNQAYRTNVGVVEASGNPVSVVLSIFNSAGDKLKDIEVGLKANEQRQLNSLLAENGIELADGRVEVRVTGGEGRVTAYAAVIDNRTRDQLFVPASTLGQGASSKYVVPGIADLIAGAARWRSDMRIFNSGDSPQSATLTLYPQNSSGAPLSASVTVEAGEVKVLDNIVQALFGASNTGGAVHVETPTASPLVVTARTYNQTTAGTLGLFIPAVTPAEAIGAAERSLNLLQAEDSVRYRTNVGIAEVTGNPVVVEMMIHLPDTKVTPRIEVPLAANEFRQIGVLRELGIGNVYNARVSMKVISGDGRVTAYGSVIDMRTNDSTYVPAQ